MDILTDRQRQKDKQAGRQTDTQIGRDRKRQTVTKRGGKVFKKSSKK